MTHAGMPSTGVLAGGAVVGGVLAAGIGLAAEAEAVAEAGA